jgi:hypothetical protein
MKRTTIMGDEDTLEQLRQIAREERKSLAEVIREGLEWRARQRRSRRLRFIGVGASGIVDTAERASEMPYEPSTWRS